VFAKVRSSQERLDNIPSILKRFRQAVLAAACDGRLTADWRETHDLGDRSGQLVQSILRIREKTWKTRQAGKSRAVRYAQPFVPNPTLELDVPSSWSLVTVSQLALLDVGFAFKSSEFAASGIRLLRGENVEPGRLRWTETRFFPSQELSGLEHLLIDEGEIILALDRPLISTGLKLARSVKEDLPCLLVQRVMRFKMADPRTTQWLYCNLRLPRFIEHLSKGLTGTDLPHVTGTGVAEFAIGLPSLDEQSEIIERVERLLNLADRLQTRYAKAKAQVNKLTQAVLAKAFRGELVPTEAELARLEGREYESAEQLLERIRATHTASNEDRPRAGREHAAARAQKGTRRYAR
jgi:type I restriction enzyme S subunit